MAQNQVAQTLDGLPPHTSVAARQGATIKKARVTEVSDGLGRKLVFIGDGSAGGTYVLRIRIRKPIAIALGRFKKGKIFAFRPGDYAYVGSAMGKNGHAVCLSKRLVRHASRLGGNKPHPIRELMRSQFPKHLRAAGELISQNPKKQKWQVDCALDHANVELVGVYVISTPLRIEGRLAKFLETEPGTHVFERGAGASDIKGNTHFLRVDDGETWWDQLRDQIRRVLLVEQLLSVHPHFEELVVGNRLRITSRQLITLLNMWHERSRDIFQRMANGDSFTRAQIDSQNIYDTCHWGEVISRLCRARGSLKRVSAAFDKSGGQSGIDAADRRTFLGLVVEAQRIGHALGSELVKLAPVGSYTHPGDTFSKTETLFAVGGEPTAGKLSGFLKQSIRFLEKCLHDVPLIASKTASVLTFKQMGRIVGEFDQITETLEKIAKDWTTTDEPSFL